MDYDKDSEGWSSCGVNDWKTYLTQTASNYGHELNCMDILGGSPSGGKTSNNIKRQVFVLVDLYLDYLKGHIEIFSENVSDIGTSNSCLDAELSNIESKLSMEENGWIFHVSHSDTALYSDRCGINGWFGFYAGSYVGKVSATFKESVTATLEYGNCWSDKEVDVYLNHENISSGYGN